MLLTHALYAALCSLNAVSCSSDCLSAFFEFGPIWLFCATSAFLSWLSDLHTYPHIMYWCPKAELLEA